MSEVLLYHNRMLLEPVQHLCSSFRHQKTIEFGRLLRARRCAHCLPPADKHTLHKYKNYYTNAKITTQMRKILHTSIQGHAGPASWGRTWYLYMPNSWTTSSSRDMKSCSAFELSDVGFMIHHLLFIAFFRGF